MTSGSVIKISRKDDLQGENLVVVEETTVNYYVRSEVLGNKIIAEVKPDATKRQGNVYANGALLAEWNNGVAQVIEMNPLTGSFYKTDHNASAWREERDPRGISTGLEDPWLYVETPTYHDLIGNQQPLFLEMGGDPFNASGGCERDGMPYSCSALQRDIDNGSIEGQGSDGTPYSNAWLQRNVFWGSNSYSVFVPGTGSGDVTWIGPDGATPPTQTDFGPGGSWQTFYFGGFGGSRPPRQPHPPSGPPPPPRRCPTYSELTTAQQNAIRDEDTYEGLSDFQKAKYLNATAAMSTAEIDYSGLTYEKDGFDEEDRDSVMFTGANASARDSVLRQMGSGGRQFSEDIGGKHPLFEAYRRSVTKNSLHIGFGNDPTTTIGKTMVHVDPYGASSGLAGVFFHIVNDVARPKIVRKFGGHYEPDPFKIAKRFKGKAKGAICL